MLIGELSKRTGFSKDTIRYYEKLALIQPAYRRESRYREYTDEAVSTLRFIREVKALGFTLSEIKDIIDAFQRQTYTCDKASDYVRDKIRHIETEIEKLNHYKDRLTVLMDSCDRYLPQEMCAAFEKLWES